MTYTPAPVQMPVGPFVGPFSRESLLGCPTAGSVTTGSATANRIYYFPICLPEAVTVRRFWWANGATVAGNVQVGIYDDNGGTPGARLGQGTSTAAAGASVVQFDDITDVGLAAGSYWLAIVASSGTQTFQTTAAILLSTKYYESGAGGLPSTANANQTANAGGHQYLFGFTSRAAP